jgi:hypothetical protein
MAGTTATVGVAINPQQAQAGAAAVVKAFQDVTNAANQMAAAMKGAVPPGHREQVQGAANIWGTFATAIQSSLGPAQTMLRAIGPLGDAAMLAAARVERGALAMEAMGKAAEGARLGLAGAIATVGTVVGILAALGLAIEAVNKAWEFLKDSISEAAALQRMQTTFTAITGSAAEAQDQFKKLHDFWETSGVFNLHDLEKAAIQLELMGANAQNTAKYVESLSTAAAAVDTSVTRMGDAFESVMLGRVWRPTQETQLLLRQMAQDLGKTPEGILNWIRTTDPVTRMRAAVEAMRDLGTAGSVTFDAIAERQKTFDGQLQVIQNRWEALKIAIGTPLIPVLTQFLAQVSEKLQDLYPVVEELGRRIARLVDDFAQIAREQGWSNAIKAAWDVMLDEIAISTRNKLRSIFTIGFDPKQAAEGFKDIQSAMDAYQQAALERYSAQGVPEWEARIKAAWDTIRARFTGEIYKAQQDGTKAVADMDDSLVNQLQTDREKLASATAQLSSDFSNLFKPFTTGFQLFVSPEQIQKQVQQVFDVDLTGEGEKAGDSFLKGAEKSLSEGKLEIQLPAIATETTAGLFQLPATLKAYRDSVLGAAYAQDHFILGADKGAHTLKEFQSDLELFNKYWEEYSKIQAFSSTSTERTNRTMTELEKTIRESADPMEQVKRLMPYLTPDEGKMATAIANVRSLEIEYKNLEALVKGGMATPLQGFDAGIMQLQKDWGTFAEQVQKATVDIGKALETDITNGLVSILDGTKSAAQGFKDMALSIVKSLEQIIIKMLVVQALERLTGLFNVGGAPGGGGSASGVGANWIYTGGSATGGASLLHGGGTIRRYQTGGGIGGWNPEPLEADERVIIAEVGEGVFTEKQMQNLFPLDRSAFRADQLRAMESGWSNRIMPSISRVGEFFGLSGLGSGGVGGGTGGGRRHGGGLLRFRTGGVMTADMYASGNWGISQAPGGGFNYYNPSTNQSAWAPVDFGAGGGGWSAGGVEPTPIPFSGGADYSSWTLPSYFGGSSVGSWSGGGANPWGTQFSYGYGGAASLDISGFGGGGGTTYTPPIWLYGSSSGTGGGGSNPWGTGFIGVYGGATAAPPPGAIDMGGGLFMDPITGAIYSSTLGAAGASSGTAGAGGGTGGGQHYLYITGGGTGVNWGMGGGGQGIGASYQVSLSPSAPFSSSSSSGLGVSGGVGPGFSGSSGAGGGYSGYGGTFAGYSGGAYSAGMGAALSTPGIGMAGSIGSHQSFGGMQHGGGVIGWIPSFQQGGIMPHTGLAFLHAGEQVTPSSNISNVSTQTITNQVTVHVEYKDGGARSSMSGIGDQEAQDLARFVSAMVDKKIADNRRFGKPLYRSRDQRNPAAA